MASGASGDAEAGSASGASWGVGAESGSGVVLTHPEYGRAGRGHRPAWAHGTLLSVAPGGRGEPFSAHRETFRPSGPIHGPPERGLPTWHEFPWAAPPRVMGAAVVSHG
ncbi:hypothetical protein Stube_39560 [Streptomyces tubercidicus]|uniref:Uncharacterized protein n=1 Tax=Streptomyces tubercidicus TaxID=47759 RepID=A0A640UTC5_9ACTN|nr:hypothetical protein Stube_39560 [Streptomyces tubercidicus]